jgi:CBS domain-containing protein
MTATPGRNFELPACGRFTSRESRAENGAPEEGDRTMKVREIMSREVRTVTPQTTLGEAALLMRQADIGALLVNEGERLTGVVTDRDLAVRGLADGLGADRPVREVMSGELRYCFEDEEVDHVAKNMAQLEKRRLPVMDRNKRLVGIVSLANIATCNTDKLSANLLRGVARAH